MKKFLLAMFCVALLGGFAVTPVSAVHVVIDPGKDDTISIEDTPATWVCPYCGDENLVDVPHFCLEDGPRWAPGR